MARQLIIKENRRLSPLSVVGPNDFVYEAGTEISEEEILRNPKFTLYCFDPANQAVMFVESRDQTAVDRAPFYYQGQVAQAAGLVSMPLEAFHRVARQIPDPPKGFIFVHSVGRCGSTLISKVLAAIPSVHSLSEPDDLTQAIKFRTAEGASESHVLDLIFSSIKWRGKARGGIEADRVAIKTRSEVLVLGDLIATSFPQAKHFFLYREAFSWLRSVCRDLSPEKRVEDPESNRKYEEAKARTLALIREYRREDKALSSTQIRILGWVTCMEAYLRLRQMGVSIRASRFEEITANPRPVIERFIEFCGIEGADWTAIEEVLGRDSQAGTVLERSARSSQSWEISREQIQEVHDLLATRPLLLRPDVILPGTED